MCAKKAKPKAMKLNAEFYNQPVLYNRKLGTDKLGAKWGNQVYVRVWPEDAIGIIHTRPARSADFKKFKKAWAKYRRELA